VVEDTGFSSWLPSGSGVLPFNDLAGAVHAIDEVERNYQRHCVAARQVAVEYFDSRAVLTDLIERATS
jgi:hypothetical protein